MGKDSNDCTLKPHKLSARLSEFNMEDNWNKCKLFKSELKVLGHIVNERGLFSCLEKNELIEIAKALRNVSEFKSYLGSIDYYHKVLPHFLKNMDCRYNLLKKMGKGCNDVLKRIGPILPDVGYQMF